MERAATTPRRRPGTLPRAQQAEETRKRLFRAAARVVGTDGYAEASVAKITSLAGVAQGTFYNYFDTRQTLLDELLSNLGDDLLDFIRSRISGSTSAVDRERRQMEAFSDFLRERPEFYRILHEAEIHAPDSYRRHVEKVERHFLLALREDWRRGELPSLDEAELDVAAQLMMAARVFLMRRYCLRGQDVRPIPPKVIAAYMRIITNGVFAQAQRPRKAHRALTRMNNDS